MGHTMLVCACGCLVWATCFWLPNGRPPFPYSKDAPPYRLCHTEWNKVIQHDIIRLDTWKIAKPLDMKLTFGDHLSHAAVTHGHPLIVWVAMHDRLKLHLLPMVETWDSTLLRDERMCHLCYQGPQPKKHYSCMCIEYYETWGKFHWHLDPPSVGLWTALIINAWDFFYYSSVNIKCHYYTTYWQEVEPETQLRASRLTCSIPRLGK